MLIYLSQQWTRKLAYSKNNKNIRTIEYRRKKLCVIEMVYSRLACIEIAMRNVSRMPVIWIFAWKPINSYQIEPSLILTADRFIEIRS